MKKLNILSIIPARGGSVRVPKKNVKLLNGKPLIAYAIEASQQSKYVNRIIVSTDSDEIKKVANKYGAETPFKRPSDISEDVPTEDVALHAIKWMEENEGYYADIVVCLEPPSPFRKSEHIDTCVEKLLTDVNLDSAITVNPVVKRPETMVRIDKNGKISSYSGFFESQGEALLRFPASQIYESIYSPNGVVFSCRSSTLYRYGSLVGTSCVGIDIGTEDIFDLDYPEDFELCELMIQKRLGKKRS